MTDRGREAFKTITDILQESSDTAAPLAVVEKKFGVPYWQVALSMGILILAFLGTTWMAAKIYRTGILMYGKKVSYRELWKWLRY